MYICIYTHPSPPLTLQSAAMIDDRCGQARQTDRSLALSIGR